MWDINGLKDLVLTHAYPVMMEEYEARPTVREQIFQIEALSDDNLYGTKGSVLSGAGQLSEIPHGGDIPEDAIAPVGTWYARFRKFAQVHAVPFEALNQSTAEAVGRELSEVARSIGAAWAMQKEDIAARIFNKGSLTAGDSVFDGSFTNNADPYPLFVYDGLPFFDTAHADLAGNTYANHVVSAALTSTTLQAATILMENTNAKDSRGNRILIRPDTLLVPSALQFSAATLLNSTLLPGSANNDVNPLQSKYNLISWPALTQSAGWFLGESRKGITFFDSGAPRIRVFVDEKKQVYNFFFSSYAGVVVKDWHYWSAHNVVAA